MCIAVAAVGGIGAAGADTPGAEGFTFTGKSDTYCVPAGVTSVLITASGGAGGQFKHTGTFGAGGSVTGTFPVTPNTQLIVTVGGRGNNNGGFGDGYGGRHGTAVGDAYGYSGAGGGGSTAIKTTSRPCGTNPGKGDKYLVVAGGGGGGGGWASGYHGGAGGAGIGKPGTTGDGTPADSPTEDNGADPGKGGCGGKAPGGGCNKSITGGRGTDGPDVGLFSGGGGGGGGGGYNGGGKGHGDGTGESYDKFGAGGGGGGGASYADPRGTGVTITASRDGSVDGSVSISAVTNPASGGPLSGLFGSS